MLKSFTATLFLCAALTAQTPKDPWQSLRFLLGTWDAKTEGGSAGADSSGSYTFALDLHDHILARHSANASCKAPTDFNCEHTDLLYVYSEIPGQPLAAIYFDNEGHVIHYDVTTPDANTVIFLSAASQSAPQFRLMYTRKGSTMGGKFQARMPGQSDFRSYLEWSGAKK
jgi:hypothetical protein